MSESLIINIENNLKELTNQYSETHENFHTSEAKHLYHSLIEYRSMLLNSDFSPTEIVKYKDNLQKVLGLVNEISKVFDDYEASIVCCFGKQQVVDSCGRIERELDELFTEMQLILPHTARIRSDSHTHVHSHLHTVPDRTPSRGVILQAGHHLGYDLTIPDTFVWPNKNPLDVIRLFQEGTLDLSECYVTLDSLSDMVHIIENGKVQEIKLPWSVIPPVKFDSVVEFVKESMKPFPMSTWRIDLDYARFDTTKFELFCLVLPQFQELSTFAFSHNHFGPTGVFFISEALARCPSLVELTLSHNDINDDSVCHLAKLLSTSLSLEKIDFSHNDIGHNGMEVLAESIKGLIHLNEVKFSHNPLGCEGVASLALALRSSDKLRILELSHVNLLSCGLVELADSLEGWKHLFSMDLSENEIDSFVAKDLFKNMLNHPALSRLNLVENDIDEKTVGWMVQNRPRKLSMLQT
eukprot:TRINITY_DN2278_c0_g2_i1.p1 TRINITY_DN2278_c0_g2~~TRINITY_DN2278_c0_g2_i1.p1  ORF type:complete len:474 (+),score=148.65 TRINITY_DN2278_c0_g2_i1:23-1423(+)